MPNLRITEYLFRDRNRGLYLVLAPSSFMLARRFITILARKRIITIPRRKRG